MLSSRLGVFALCCALCACGASSESPLDASTLTDFGNDAGLADAGRAEPYSITILDNARITSIASEPNFQKAEGAVPALHDAPFAHVTLVVDLATTCFPFESWAANAPPEGENWPANCDAFDRNFETSLIDPAMPDAPALELVRAITPFGGPMHLEVDVTDVWNTVRDARTLRIVIPTWSDSEGQVSGSMGGWNVSARLDVTPGAPSNRVLAVSSLVYGSFNESTSAHESSFTVPAGTTYTRIEYRVTGHGGGTGGIGCIGPADEFCMRAHTLTLDGEALARPTPWRNDCASLCTLAHYTPASGGDGFDYCAENPCGAPQSVRAPRANWCPGSTTMPLVYEPSLSTDEAHSFAFAIDGVPPGAEWRVSATLYAYGDL